MIKEIKKQRLIYILKGILNECFCEGGRYSIMTDDMTFYHGVFRISETEVIHIQYNFFIELGMNPNITEEELKTIIHERFIKSN